MLSTAWSRTDPFWTVWADDDPSWLRLKATADTVDIFPEQFLAQERRALGEDGFKREYLGIPLGCAAPAHSAGIYMSARREFRCRWCSPARPFNRPLRHPPYLSPIRSNAFKHPE